MKNNPIRYLNVLYSSLKIATLKLFHWKSFKAPLLQHLNLKTTIDLQGELIIDGKIGTEPGVLIAVRKNGKMRIGNNVFFNRNVIIVVREEITFGSGSMVGPGVCFYDHDHKYDENGIIGDKYLTNPISIGKGCWIGANAIILRGTILGDHCIVGAGTIVKGHYPSYSKIYNKRDVAVSKITP